MLNEGEIRPAVHGLRNLCVRQTVGQHRAPTLIRPAVPGHPVARGSTKFIQSLCVSVNVSIVAEGRGSALTLDCSSVRWCFAAISIICLKAVRFCRSGSYSQATDAKSMVRPTATGIGTA